MEEEKKEFTLEEFIEYNLKRRPEIRTLREQILLDLLWSNESFDSLDTWKRNK